MSVGRAGLPRTTPDLRFPRRKSVLRCVASESESGKTGLHTPGGLLLAAEQIAKALVEHKGKVTVFVPHYAMSGGTLMALAADDIVMDSNAVLGSVEPQIGDLPAALIVRMVEMKKPSNVSDEMLVMAGITQIYELMDLYPQTGSGRPSVLYVPLRRLSGDGPRRTASPDQLLVQR